MIKIKNVKRKQTFTRAELLEILVELETRVGIESFSRVLDIKEELGFQRGEGE
jgi:hypothetical protein